MRWDQTFSRLEAIRGSSVHRDGILINITADSSGIRAAESCVGALLDCCRPVSGCYGPWLRAARKPEPS